MASISLKTVPADLTFLINIDISIGRVLQTHFLRVARFLGLIINSTVLVPQF
jgi:hypothetical protein